MSLQRTIDPLGPSDEYGVDIYCQLITFFLHLSNHSTLLTLGACAAGLRYILALHAPDIYIYIYDEQSGLCKHLHISN